MSDLSPEWFALASTVASAKMEVFWEEQYTWAQLCSRATRSIDMDYRSDAIMALQKAWDALKAFETANPELTPVDGHKMINDQVAEAIAEIREVDQLVKSGTLNT